MLCVCTQMRTQSPALLFTNINNIFNIDIYPTNLSLKIFLSTGKRGQLFVSSAKQVEISIQQKKTLTIMQTTPNLTWNVKQTMRLQRETLYVIITQQSRTFSQLCFMLVRVYHTYTHMHTYMHIRYSIKAYTHLYIEIVERTYTGF